MRHLPPGMSLRVCSGPPMRQLTQPAAVRVLLWRGPRQMAVETVDEPRPGVDEVIVQPEAAGICGSEIEGYLGRMSNRTPPLVMGHEFAGTVLIAGGGTGGVGSGRRVAVNPLVSCRAG